MSGGTKPKFKKIKEGEDLVRQGQGGTEVYLILDGIFVVEIDGEEVAEIGPGAVVGERAALVNGTRTATLWARTAGRVAERAVRRPRPGGAWQPRRGAPPRGVTCPRLADLVGLDVVLEVQACVE